MLGNNALNMLTAVVSLGLRCRNLVTCITDMNFEAENVVPLLAFMVQKRILDRGIRYPAWHKRTIF